MTGRDHPVARGTLHAQARGGAEAPKYVQKLDKQGRAYATGKRKNAVARVWIKLGAGKIVINTRPVETYFARPVLRMMIQQPLVAANRKANTTWSARSPAADCRARPARCATACPRR